MRVGKEKRYDLAVAWLDRQVRMVALNIDRYSGMRCSGSVCLKQRRGVAQGALPYKEHKVIIIENVSGDALAENPDQPSGRLINHVSECEFTRRDVVFIIVVDTCAHNGLVDHPLDMPSSSTIFRVFRRLNQNCLLRKKFQCTHEVLASLTIICDVQSLVNG